MSAPRRCDAPAIAAISPSNVASAWSRRLCLVLVLLQATSVFAPACICSRCGETTSGFSSGNCGPANNHDCSATLTPAGYTGVGWCYTDCSAACDCASNQCTLPPSPPPSPALPPPPPSPPPPAPPPPPFGPACCRWTAAAVANKTCSPIDDRCTRLHEYLEHKTTTHVFEDVNACLGSDPTIWAWQFDGTTSSTTLSTGTAVAAAVPTPLKVTHAADCASTAPTLSLQMDTVVLGSLTVGGFDVAATFLALGANPGRNPNPHPNPNLTPTLALTLTLTL